MINNHTNIYLNAYFLIYMVKQIRVFFTDSEVEGVQRVRKLQQHLYFPLTSNFKTFLREVMIRNFLLNPEDSVGSNHIYGPAIPLLQRGMKHRVNPFKMVPRVRLSACIFMMHSNIGLYFGFLYERNAFPP